MLPEIELLQYIHKTAEMGCQGILTVLSHTKNTSLHQVLEEQRAEYQKLGREAERLLSARGEDATKLGAMAKISSELMANGQMLFDDSVSKIAEMTIQGNNMGVSKTLQHLHDYHGEDEGVRSLTRKLLATEEANVEQLKSFL